MDPVPWGLDLETEADRMCYKFGIRHWQPRVRELLWEKLDSVSRLHRRHSETR